MTLLQRLSDGSAVFGVVGLGYVGLPLVVEMARSGHHVIGIDVAADKVAEIIGGAQLHPRRPLRRARRAGLGGLIEATTDFSRAGECDVDRHLRPDAARRDEGAGHLLHGVRRPPDRPVPAPGDAGHARVDDLSRYHRGDRAADPGDAST